MMTSRMRMKLIFESNEFFHTFTQYTSMLLMCGNPNSPFFAELCQTQLKDEIFRHAVEQKKTLPYFMAMHWDPNNWLNVLAQNLDAVEYVWVETPLAVVHPGGHLLEPAETSSADDEEWD